VGGAVIYNHFVWVVRSEHYDPSRSVVLTGFMGAGKTTIGSLVAKLLRRTFYDLDEIILRNYGQLPLDLLLEGDEQKFREIEKNTALELLRKGPSVIAFGGGTMEDSLVRERSLSVAFVVYLKASFPTLWERIQSSNAFRPLAQRLGKDGLERLLASREPNYEKAHFTVFAELYEPAFLAKVIRHGFNH